MQAAFSPALIRRYDTDINLIGVALSYMCLTFTYDETVLVTIGLL